MISLVRCLASTQTAESKSNMFFFCFLSNRILQNFRFALDVHWRFLMMFGTVVMKVPQHQYDKVLKVERAACGVGDNSQLDIKSLQVVVHKFKKLAEVFNFAPSFLIEI